MFQALRNKSQMFFSGSGDRRRTASNRYVLRELVKQIIPFALKNDSAGRGQLPGKLILRNAKLLLAVSQAFREDTREALGNHIKDLVWGLGIQVDEMISLDDEFDKICTEGRLAKARHDREGRLLALQRAFNYLEMYNKMVYL